METKEKQNGILEGVIWKQLLLFFFPILIGTFFQQLYNTVDTVIVGQFAGKEALSSVGGSSAQIINMVVGFFTGLTAGGTVLISQAYGASHKQRLEDALHTSYAFGLLGGIGLGILGGCGGTAYSGMDEYAKGTDGDVYTVHKDLFFRSGICIYL